MRFFRLDSQYWQVIMPGLVISKGHGSGWVRLFGRRIKVRDVRAGWVPFSVRYGIAPSLKIGPFIVAAGG
jgi:hypothetical protein